MERLHRNIYVVFIQRGFWGLGIPQSGEIRFKGASEAGPGLNHSSLLCDKKVMNLWTFLNISNLNFPKTFAWKALP